MNYHSIDLNDQSLPKQKNLLRINELQDYDSFFLDSGINNKAYT